MISRFRRPNEQDRENRQHRARSRACLVFVYARCEEAGSPGQPGPGDGAGCPGRADRACRATGEPANRAADRTGEHSAGRTGERAASRTGPGAPRNARAIRHARERRPHARPFHMGRRRQERDPPQIRAGQGRSGRREPARSVRLLLFPARRDRRPRNRIFLRTRVPHRSRLLQRRRQTQSLTRRQLPRHIPGRPRWRFFHLYRRDGHGRRQERPPFRGQLPPRPQGRKGNPP